MAISDDERWANLKMGWPTAADLAACVPLDVPVSPICPVCTGRHDRPPMGETELGTCIYCGQCLCACDELDQLAADEAAAKDSG